MSGLLGDLTSKFHNGCIEATGSLCLQQTPDQHGEIALVYCFSQYLLVIKLLTCLPG